MRSFNRVILMGHLGQAPELHVAKSGRPYTRLNVATNRFAGQGEDGKRKQVSEWHSVFVWGDQAQNCSAFLRKGACVLVEGSLSYWQVAEDAGSPNPKKEYKNAIQADIVRFISYGRPSEGAVDMENLDNSEVPRNH
ncbi:MAG TPA: single-stranded DNA-binding protein [Bdellovibrionales bacterium]|nr:single-stranded DNA-binding protein [Bdellovibrionales bacterium]